ISILPQNKKQNSNQYSIPVQTQTSKMMSMIRSSITKATTARRLISNSTKSNNVAYTLGHEASHTAPASSSSSSVLKAVAYTVLGSTAVVAGVSHLLKDEVIYWTPNVRK
ncbi:hypothetical protein BGW38_007349, partial [Lunasporangiospora selenospora]